MVNYDAILYLVSIVLVLLILFMILFGCKSNGRRYYEKFENKDDKLEEGEDEHDEGETKKPTINKQEHEKGQKVNKNKEEPYLSNFENQILSQLSSGQLTTEAFTNLIANQQFTQTNLENMINYVEYNKGSLSNN